MGRAKVVKSKEGTPQLRLDDDDGFYWYSLRLTDVLDLRDSIKEFLQENREEEEIWQPSEDDKKLQRYGFLFGKRNLSPEEQQEKKTLKEHLQTLGRDPGWE